MAQMTLTKITFNATSGMYEARVDIKRDGTTYRYPCAVPGTLVTDKATVREHLLEQALHMSDSGDLRSVV